MSHSRADEDVVSDNNSISVQSNEADSDESSWNDESDVKRKPNLPRSQPKPHKSKRKSSKKKRRSNRKSTEKNYSDAEISETVIPSKSTYAKQESKEESSMKSDHFSDDVNSVMSDINPPSLATRSRIRKLFNRQAWKGSGSASSSYTVESDGKKAKSEPILITIDSDSEDDHVSTISSQPSRSARLKGEMLRKLQRMSGLKKSVNCSSSSSDSESPRKSKKRVKSSSSSKKVRYRVPTKSDHKHIKHKKSCKTLIFTPSHKRHLKIRKIKKRLEKQKFEKRNIPIRQSRITPSQSNTMSPISKASSSGRRSLRNNSSGINYLEEEDKANVRLERRTRRSLSDHKSGKDETADNINKKRSNRNSTHINDENAEENKLEESENESEQVPEDKNENNDAGTGLQSSEAENENCKKTDEKLNDIKNEIDMINNTVVDKDYDDTNEAEGTNVSKADNFGKRETKSKMDIRSRRAITSKIIVKRKVGRKKKIIPPPPNSIRRPGRGRPRKIIIDDNSESKPVTESFNILNIKPQVPFLQNSFCFDVAPKLAKCRECRLAIYKSSKRMYNSYCRFMEYRKLCYNKSGMISSAGFSNPNDAAAEHLSLWFPQFLNPPKDLNIETAKSLLEHIGDQFCDLVGQEREALNLHIGLQQLITWKRVVQGVREMCDVCSTTIFNIHWVCPQCGLAVCIDCYKVRKQGEVASYDDDEQPKDRDEFKWLLCTMRTPHRQDSLVMAQIIPGTALWMMRDWLHKAREKWNIPSYCKCTKPKESPTDNLVTTGINKQLMSHVSNCFNPERIQTSAPEKGPFRSDNYDDLDIEVSGSALRWLDNSSIMNENPNRNQRISDDYFNSFEDLVLLRGADLMQDASPPSDTDNELSNFSLDDIITSVKNLHNTEEKENSEKFSVKHFSQRYPQQKSGRDPLPIRIYTKIESKIAFPTVPHSWFCNGRLLFLHQATHPENLTLFQEQWKRGQPILVKSVDENLNMDLWTPDGFSRDFGEVKNDLVDCKTGNIIKNLPMRKFWEGFENMQKRLRDDDDEPLLLKLKDWPPGEDFSEKLPTRFEDLMKGLPLPEYTYRDGILNLAGRLPLSFVRPDLGPKMYNAYGSALFPTKGTTNLHLDVSDAVNVMVYVGIPSDDNSQIHVHEALKAIDEGGCDSLMRARVRGKNCKPGALWHIYNARDADKIRQMLNKVAIERGEKLEPNHDPIHDQSWYIDSELRLKLYREYGVEGYAIAQCLGDAVFIPAGAPHQVRNLHSCVKVAEDFVSPENIAHCFKLTQEFRQLSDTHTNHEDKLQIKNIIYHVVKDALSHLLTDPEAQSAQAGLL